MDDLFAMGLPVAVHTAALPDKLQPVAESSSSEVDGHQLFKKLVSRAYTAKAADGGSELLHPIDRMRAEYKTAAQIKAQKIAKKEAAAAASNNRAWNGRKAMPLGKKLPGEKMAEKMAEKVRAARKGKVPKKLRG